MCFVFEILFEDYRRFFLSNRLNKYFVYEMNRCDEVSGLLIEQFNFCKFGSMFVYNLLNNVQEQYMSAMFIPLKFHNISINLIGIYKILAPHKINYYLVG